MANYNNTTLRCTNKRVIQAILDKCNVVSSTDNNDKTLRYLECGPHEIAIPNDKRYKLDELITPEIFREGKTYKLLIESRNDLFNKEATELSKKHKQSEILCRFSLEGDMYFIIYLVRYKAGKEKQYGREYSPGYITDPGIARIIGEEESNKVHERVHEFVNTLYEKELIREGEKITHEFEHGEYKLKTEIPFGPYYDTKVYKKVERKKTFSPTIYDEWAEVESGPFKVHDLPL